MNVVGKSVIRKDARAKVTGEAKFAADMYFPRMLHAAIKRSEKAHAKILSINYPEDMTVFTATDIPGENIIPVVMKDMPLLADKVTRFVGEPVAIVVSETKRNAKQLLEKIEIEYEELPAIFDPEESFHQPKIKLWEEDNIYSHHKIRKGDVEKGFEDADVIIERKYYTPYQEHAYMEPQGMVAVPEDDGGITVYGTMQCPFYVQEGVEEVLGIGLNNVTVVQTATGGGFGGKEDVPSLIGAQAALAAHLTRRPVKLIYDRDEDIICMSKRHPMVITYKIGAKKTGELVAIEVESLMDAGAYSTLSPIVAFRNIVHTSGPYRCPNVKCDTYSLATNKVPCGAFRGFGIPQAAFAHETQMDLLAEALDMDPAEIRRKNLLIEGDKTSTNQVLTYSVGSMEAMEKALKKSEWSQKWKSPKAKTGNKRYGIGISNVFYGPGLGAGGKHLSRTGAYVQVNMDGTAFFAVGTTEMGQGMHTVLSQIVSEELGISYDKIRPLKTNTSRVPDSGPTVASRATMMSGNALRDACRSIREAIFDVAKDMLGVQKVTLEEDNVVCEKGELSISDVIKECHSKRYDMAAHGFNTAPDTTWDDDTGLGKAYIVYCWATNIVEVEVDMETFVVDVKRITAAHDVGKAINPTLVEGQIEGGSVQGLGYGILEEILSIKGKIINPGFSTYIIPTAEDAPEMVPIIVESAYQEGPYGAKGFGEQPLIGVAPAVTNAIYNATGLRVEEIPATPERLLEIKRK
jgi:CO/xanthine dehydrogenase Mo-binding subunit